MIRKIAALTLCLTAIVGLACAQELGVELDGGLQGMRYSLQNGQSKLLPGESLGLNYTFPLSNNGLGLLTGITAGLYRTQATLQSSVAFAYPQVDDQGDAFLYNVRLSGYKETQRTLAVTIPVLLQYHTDGDGVQWYVDAGGKVFLPANTTTKASSQQLSLSGYYPNYDLTVSDLPKHGFGTVNGWKSSTTTQLKPGAALSAGTGVSFGISRGVRLYAGVYVDYGLTVLKSGRDSMPLITYSSSGIDNAKTNGVVSTPYAGQPKLLSFGLQVRLTWGARPAKQAARHRAQDSTLTTFQVVVRTKDQTVQPATQNVTQRTTQKATPPTAQASPPPQTTAPTPPQTQTQPPPGTAGTSLSDSELVLLQRPLEFILPGQKDIPQTQISILDDVVKVLQQHPRLRISIVGYTYDDGQPSQDNKLGQARAKAVARYLEHKGIDRHRMDISYDKQGQPSTNFDPAANYLNRRVVISPE